MKKIAIVVIVLLIVAFTAGMCYREGTINGYSKALIDCKEAIDHINTAIVHDTIYIEVDTNHSKL